MFLCYATLSIHRVLEIMLNHRLSNILVFVPPEIIEDIKDLFASVNYTH